MDTTDPLEEARRVIESLIGSLDNGSNCPTKLQIFRMKEWLTANTPKPPLPRRASVGYVRESKVDDPWRTAFSAATNFDFACERVEMIELTTEVIAALRTAGIAFEDSEKLYKNERHG